MDPSRSTVVFSGQRSSAQYDNLAKGSSSYTPGKGSDKDGQGQATITAYYDKTTVDLFNTQASGKMAVFNKPATVESYDINAGELCFTVKTPRSSQGENVHSLKVQSSLNSIGVDVREAFPNDTEMQRMAIRNRIQYGGIAMDVMTYNGKNKRQGVALQILGESTLYADNDLPPGMIAELVVPDPAKKNSSTSLRRPHVPPDKVLLEVAPYDPKTLSARVMAVIRNYVTDENTFKRGMDPKVKTTNMWISMCESLGNFSLISWAVMTKSLMNAGVIRPIVASSYGPYQISSAENAVNGVPAVLGILKAFGNLPHTGAESTSGIHRNFVLTRSTKEAYSGLKRDILRKVFYDGRIRQDAFDYDPETHETRGRDARGGKIKMSEPYGNALYNQINAFPAVVGALNDAIRSDAEWLIGKIAKGGLQGGRADIFR